jgi:hypothetical protein
VPKVEGLRLAVVCHTSGYRRTRQTRPDQTRDISG